MNNLETLKSLGVNSVGDKVYLFYKRHGQFFLDQSNNGYDFTTIDTPLVIAGRDRNLDRPVRFSQQETRYYLTHKVGLLTSTDLINWQRQGTLSNISQTSVLVSNFKINDLYLLVSGGSSIKISTSSDLSKWKVIRSPLIRSHNKHHTYEIAQVLQIGTELVIFYFEKIQYEQKPSYIIKSIYLNSNNPYAPIAGKIDFIWQEPEEWINKELGKRL